MKIVYREIDLTKGKNAALYYPEEPNEDGESLFYIIMRHVANGDISVYEWLDGREMFTDTYKYKISNMLDRFHILYAHAKGSTEKAPKYVIENADIPGSEVLSYYIIEKWEFDTRSNLGDYLSGFSDYYSISDFDILFPNKILIMKNCSGNRCSCQKHRLKNSDWGYCTGAAYVKFDIY